MYEECFVCPVAEKCRRWGDDSVCEKMLEGFVESGRDEFIIAWREYVGEYADN